MSSQPRRRQRLGAVVSHWQRFTVAVDDIAVAEFLAVQAERRLEVMGEVDEPYRRPRVYELPDDDTSRTPRTR